MRIGWSSGLRHVLLLTLLAGAQPLLAQTRGRPWVDPPGESSAPAPVRPTDQAPATAPAPAPQIAAPPAPPSPPSSGGPSQPPTQAAEPAKPPPAPAAPPVKQSARPTTPSPPAQPPSPGVAAQAPEHRGTAREAAAKAFAIRYLNAWSGSNEEALESTAEFYAPQVLFHGRTVSMKKLFDEKRRFVRRWPERDYRPREDDMGVVCNPAADICTVHAVFDFSAASPARRRISLGTGALQLIVQFIGDKPVIVAEHSTLLGQTRRRSLALEGRANE